ncbi:hypothetical protein PS15p_207356 [Mucor circinelloides]
MCRGIDNGSTSFVVPALVSHGDDVPLESTKDLLDTGSMISTISLTEAKRLCLDIKSAPLIRITYGSTSQGMSNTCVRLVCEIQSQSFPAYYTSEWLLIKITQLFLVWIGCFEFGIKLVQ